uniref:Claudin domain containing 1a n=1 Tax=Sinocyclocheilus grahami TaxID=75366 RepID=A0A672KF38_SINGR
MVDNRHATALVIAGVLSVLASVYLSVSVGSPHWYRYTSPPVRAEPNATELRALQDEFLEGDFDEKTVSDALFRMNGTLGLWWRCIQTPTDAHWYREPGKCARLLHQHEVAVYRNGYFDRCHDCIHIFDKSVLVHSYCVVCVFQIQRW